MYSKKQRWSLVFVLGLAFVLLAATDSFAQRRGPMPGDLNDNGIHDFDDCAILRSILHGAPHRFTLDQLDVDRNGVVNYRDLVYLEALAQRQAGRTPQPPAPTPRPHYIRGDVDGSGAVDERDLFHFAQILRGLARPVGGLEIADLDGDRLITVADLIILTYMVYGPPSPRT